MAQILENYMKDFLENLLKSDENERIEFKRILKKPHEIIESIVAFANTKWGILVLGVEDFKKATENERLIGISENKENYSELSHMLSRNIQPNISKYIKKYEIPIINTKKERDVIVIISIECCNEICSTLTGDTFIREYNSNRKIWNQEIIRLKYERGALKYEDEMSNIDSLEEIDNELFTRFKNSILSNNINDRQILKDNGLAIQKNNKWFLKNSWSLLFLKNPSILLSNKCWIKISYYYGNHENFSWEPNFRQRPFTIEWPLYKQIVECIKFFKEIVKSAPPILDSGSFKSSLRIPERVFSEAITNAVIHRNYAIQNDIQVRVFDNRIEIESPGCYPWHITPHNIQNERYARNPTIIRTLNRFQDAPNLDIGEWVNRMFKVMKENNLYDPQFSTITEKPHSVTVTLLNAHKIEYRDSIKNFILAQGYITNQQARNITGITDTLKMNRILWKCVNDGFLILEGEKRGSRYKLKDDNILNEKLTFIFKGGENNVLQTDNIS